MLQWRAIDETLSKSRIDFQIVNPGNSLAKLTVNFHCHNWNYAKMHYWKKKLTCEKLQHQMHTPMRFHFAQHSLLFKWLNHRLLLLLLSPLFFFCHPQFARRITCRCTCFKQRNHCAHSGFRNNIHFNIVWNSCYVFICMYKKTNAANATVPTELLQSVYENPTWKQMYLDSFDVCVCLRAIIYSCMCLLMHHFFLSLSRAVPLDAYHYVWQMVCLFAVFCFFANAKVCACSRSVIFYRFPSSSYHPFYQFISVFLHSFHSLVFLMIA